MNRVVDDPAKGLRPVCQRGHPPVFEHLAGLSMHPVNAHLANAFDIDRPVAFGMSDAEWRPLGGISQRPAGSDEGARHLGGAIVYQDAVVDGVLDRPGHLQFRIARNVRYGSSIVDGDTAGDPVRIGGSTQMGFASSIIPGVGDVLEFKVHGDPSDGQREPIAVIDRVARRVIHQIDPIIGVQTGGDIVVVPAP